MKKIIIAIVSILVLSILILVVNYLIFVNIGSRISKGKPIVKKDTIKQALLVIDIQEATTGNSSVDDYYIMKSEGLINKINSVATSSVSHDIPVIYIKNEITNLLINVLNDTYAPGSPASKLDSRLRIVSDYVINKDKNDAFSNPALDSILIKNEINKLLFAGLDLAHCVNGTILAAVNREYDISLISDAVSAKSDSLKQVKIDEFKQRGFEIISSHEYLENIL